MKPAKKTRWMTVAVTLGALSLPTFGQQRVGSDGRALDANNRIGSGGINERGQAYPPGSLGNQIVTGNVTGGREFRGFVPYSDPFEFRGSTSGVNVDRFVRQSSGVTTGGISNFNATTVQPFFGESRAVPPPPGFAQQSTSGGYVPSPLMSREAGDLRLGNPLPAGVSNVPLPQPGQLILPGPVDPSTQNPTVITASPLYGVRQWKSGDEKDEPFLQGLNVQGHVRMDSATLERMRRELQDSASPDQTDQTPDGAARDPNRIRSDALSPMESPRNRPLNDAVQNPNYDSSAALNSPIVTNAGTRQRLLVSPAQQSTQIAELQRRLQRYESRLPGTENIEANQEYARQVREQKEREAKAAQAPAPQNTATPQRGAKPDLGSGDLINQNKKPADGTAAREPSRTTTPPIPGSLRPSELAKEKPLVVSSLAEGVQAKSLKDFLAEAESLMKQGKFYSALDQYASAELVAPNNPMITLGQANAELGASYYGRAESHLRDAFMKDPALLMAQYDLKTFLGQDRLEFLVKELKEIATRDKSEPRHVFLLAYIMYNTGDERRAAAYLDLAEKRAGKTDQFYQLLRKYWILPADQEPAQDDNK